MTKRRAVWLVFGLVVLAGIALLLPSSPVYLPNYFYPVGKYFDNQPTSFWIKELANPDTDARRRAVFALGSIGPEASEAIPTLATLMLEDPDTLVRVDASLALSKMDPASKAAIPSLTQALDDKEPFVRMNAAMALFRLGPEARPAIPALCKALKDDNNQSAPGAFHYSVQGMAALALGRASAGSADAVPALTAALESAETPDQRIAVARALGEVGPLAHPAVPQLKTMLKDKDADVRQTVEQALQQIEG
jgi:HEAT repeat protein